jgi:hypothetical protein
VRKLLVTLSVTLGLVAAFAPSSQAATTPPKSKATTVKKKAKPKVRLAPAPAEPPELHMDLRADPSSLYAPTPSPGGKIVLPATHGTSMQPIELEGTSGSTERYSPSGPPNLLRGAFGPTTAPVGAPGIRY